jgi:hypothetical protein
METGNVPLDCTEPQDDLAHIVAQSIHPRENVAQMLDDQIAGLFGHRCKSYQVTA